MNRYFAAFLICAITTIVLTLLPNKSQMPKIVVTPLISSLLTLYLVGDLIGSSYQFDILDMINLTGLFFFSYAIMFGFEKVTLH